MRGPAVVAQALYRRLITPRGTLRGGEEEENYGLDVAGYVGAVGDRVAAAALPGLVRGELLKDDRVADIDAAAAIATDAAGLTYVELSIRVVLQDESEPFTLTVAVTAASATLLGGVPE